nr:DNA repair protein RecO [Desulfobulbaceae bacterium]
MPIQQTTAIVIHVADQGESDKLITFYSPQNGKFKAIAKGAKRSIKRFVNKLELFSLVSISYHDQYSIPLLSEADLINCYLTLRHNYPAYVQATLICELIRNWTHENDGDEILFRYIIWIFSQLNGNSSSNNHLLLFLVKFYNQLGYQPNINSCCACGQLTPQIGPFSFRPSLGGILCRRCSTETTPIIPLTISTLKLLQKAFLLPASKLNRLHFTSKSKEEALHFFKRYDRYLLDRELQSWGFII